ncbi:SDR family oxidoreductase [Leucobacter sp. CSA2]|uniref:SDR family oxidoreductase n=1 Tax=Leucobacter edaphi TaxID=2796472 RepID=A0A934UX30_9MICO|nr:SDR family oxidoreductase [Leucobacter edaphi]MBK0421595.1 SDR family oxidoreductase [Leucobacter edaphi]
MRQRDTGLPDLSGQRVLVTGASGGIGGGIARRFAAAGADLAVHYRGSADAAFALVEELRERGARAVAVRADLGEDGAPAALVAEAVHALGGLDGLVNNAGIQPVQLLAETSRADWDAVLATNLGAVFELSREAAAAMTAEAEREDEDRTGARWITHIASIEASRPGMAHAHYAAAKAGLVMHARAAALQLGPDGIRVNTVSPGLVDRPGLAEAWPEGVASWNERAPLGRLATAADIGNACVLLASPAASFITGQDLAVDGGMLATPGW